MNFLIACGNQLDFAFFARADINVGKFHKFDFFAFNFKQKIAVLAESKMILTALTASDT